MSVRLDGLAYQGDNVYRGQYMATNPKWEGEMTEQYLTVKRTARQLDVGEPTIRRWIAEGKLAAVRVGSRAIRIQAESIPLLLAPRGITK